MRRRRRREQCCSQAALQPFHQRRNSRRLSAWETLSASCVMMPMFLPKDTLETALSKTGIWSLQFHELRTPSPGRPSPAPANRPFCFLAQTSTLFLAPLLRSYVRLDQLHVRSFFGLSKASPTEASPTSVDSPRWSARQIRIHFLIHIMKTPNWIMCSMKIISAWSLAASLTRRMDLKTGLLLQKSENALSGIWLRL